MVYADSTKKDEGSARMSTVRERGSVEVEVGKCRERAGVMTSDMRLGELGTPTVRIKQMRTMTKLNLNLFMKREGVCTLVQDQAFSAVTPIC